MKIIILDGYTLNPGDLKWDELQALGDLEIHHRTPVDKVVQRIGDAKIVFTNKTPISKETMDLCPNLEYIGVLATGYDVVDLEAANKKSIHVSNIPSYGTNSVAQFTVALLLELCHHVGSHSQAVQDGEWTDNPDWSFWKHPLIELDGKTIGIIGFGRIGQRTGEICQAMGMKVLAHSNRKRKELETDTLRYVELDELLAKSDVISLHSPLTEDTEGMINKETIAKMKDGVMIINTARGGLIVEEDLAQALNSGKVAGSASDVVSTEPIEMDNPLILAKNALITPHIAWAPRESRARIMAMAADNLDSYLKGNPKNIVNNPLS